MCFFFFFNDTATTEIYPLSLHDALPISERTDGGGDRRIDRDRSRDVATAETPHAHRLAEGQSGKSLETGSGARSEEHTSELQALAYLVFRLLLEKKKCTRRYGAVSDPQS